MSFLFYFLRNVSTTRGLHHVIFRLIEIDYAPQSFLFASFFSASSVYFFTCSRIDKWNCGNDRNVCLTLGHDLNQFDGAHIWFGCKASTTSAYKPKGIPNKWIFITNFRVIIMMEILSICVLYRTKHIVKKQLTFISSMENHPYIRQWNNQFLRSEYIYGDNNDSDD